MGRVAGVVLAAGSGSRMGLPKAELVLAGERLVDRAVRVLAGCCDEVCVVGRAGLAVPGTRVIVNHAPERGMRSSLALGLAAASSVDAIAVLLVDTPGVTAAAARAVVAGWRPGRIAVGRYAGRRGHPTVMAPALWQQALVLAAEDEGARGLLAARAELVDEIDVPGSADDLDMPSDVARWERSSALGDPYTLSRFVAAQDERDTYVRALDELRRGRKSSHWMWFVFPQLDGLGHSATARRYAIGSLDEARAYLAHPVLGPRLRECCAVLLTVPGPSGRSAPSHPSATEIFGGIDAVKLRSSMTLFHRADPRETVFREVLDRFFGGEPDSATDALL